jgi:hypothetical protein
MADNAGGAGTPSKIGAPTTGKDSNAHVSTAAKLQGAAGGGDSDPKVVQAVKDAQQAGADASEAAQKAAPTGKDIPEIAAENIKGHSTAASKPDQPTADNQKSRGAQLEPALIAKDGGSIPHAMVSSPTGPVPAAAFGNGAEALAKFGASLKRDQENDDLSEEKLLTMNKHEIRSVAHDRGYKIGEGSSRALTRRFLEAQASAKKEK